MPTARNLSETIKSTINSNFLNLSGGILGGELKVDANIMRVNNSGRLHIGGGSAWDKGALLYLDGMENNTAGHKGGFQLQARNSSGVTLLDGRVDGTLTWGGKKVVCVESWRSGYNWYRKYSDGFIEQGGTFGANTGSWADVTFSLPIAFSNTNYNIFLQGNWNGPECSSCWVHARSASSITVRHANNYYSTMPSYFVAYGT